VIWSWLIGSRLGRTASAVAAALILFWGIIAQQRRDAGKDALRDAKEKDRDNADDIRSRVRDVPDRVRDFSDRVYRD
jgi:hypothetical protein